jgi:hypothetical protein
MTNPPTADKTKSCHYCTNCMVSVIGILSILLAATSRSYREKRELIVICDYRLILCQNISSKKDGAQRHNNFRHFSAF